MPDNLSCSADSFRLEIATSEKQFALFSVHGWQCFVFTVGSVSCSRFTVFVFTVHSVLCSRDFSVATFQSGLASQKPFMFQITLHPLDSAERATEDSPSAII